MREVTATEFTRNFGQYREIAQGEPVAVTSHGRTTGYFVSAAEFEELQRLKAYTGHTMAPRELATYLSQQYRRKPEDGNADNSGGGNAAQNGGITREAGREENEGDHYLGGRTRKR